MQFDAKYLDQDPGAVVSLRQSRYYSNRRANPGRRTCRQLLPSLLAVSGATTQRKTVTANAPPSWVEKEMEERQSEDSDDGSASNMSPGTFVGYYSFAELGPQPTPPPQSMSALDRSSSPSSIQPSHTPASQVGVTVTILL